MNTILEKIDRENKLCYLLGDFNIDLFKTLNQLLNTPTKNNKLTKTFVESNSSNIIEDPEEKTNKFNDYFINIGPNLAKKNKM